MCGVRCRDGASFFHVDTLHHLLKQPSFPHSADTLIKHCMCAQLLSCVQLFCDLMDWSPPGSSVHGILQARILKWVAMPPPPEDLPDPEPEPMSLKLDRKSVV